jgi:hypothetical protein
MFIGDVLTGEVSTSTKSQGMKANCGVGRAAVWNFLTEKDLRFQF